MKGRTFFTTMLVVMMLSSILAPFALAQEPAAVAETEIQAEQPTEAELQEQWTEGLITAEEFKKAMDQYYPPQGSTASVGLDNGGPTCAVAPLVSLDAGTIYNDSGTTCGGGHDYDSNVCSSLYDGGEDVVYELDIITPGVYHIALSNTDSWTGFMVTDDCPDVATTCIGYVGGGSTGNPSGDITFAAAGTYFLQIDTWPSPDCTAFDLEITGPPLPAPVLEESYKAAPGKITYGEPITYSIYLENTGELDAENLHLEDPIPDGTTYVDGSLVCDSGYCWYDEGTDTVYWEGGLRAPDVVAQQPTAARRGLDLAGSRAIKPDSPPIDIHDISTSTVNSISPDELVINVPTDICFNVTVDGGAWEWMADLEVDLPDNWSINEVYSTTSTTFCPYTKGITVGNEIYWQSTDIDFCGGAWENGTYDFCANVTIPDCTAAPWDFDWHLAGDEWGPPPHEISGTVGTASCLDTGLFLLPSTLEAEGCQGLTQTHTLNLLNLTGSEGTFTLSYDVPSGNGSLSGPDSIYLADGVDQDFIIELTPDACLEVGEQVIAAVDVVSSTGTYSDTTLITKTIVADTWYFQAPIPNPRGDGAVVAVNDGVYFVGGTYAGGTPLGDNERYDVPSDSWTIMSPMTVPMTLIDGDAVDDVIYIPGGYDGGTFTTTVQAYDTGTDSWTNVAPAPRGVAAYAAAACDGLLYRSGGAELTNWPTGTVGLEVYDPLLDSWTSLASMTHGHMWHAMECIDGKLYVAGGIGGDALDSAVAEVYDIATDTWSDDAMADLPATCWGAGDYQKHDMLHLASGIAGGFIVPNVLRYNQIYDVWEFGAPLNDIRYRLEADYAVDSAYAQGGWNPIWVPHASNEYLAQCPTCLPTETNIWFSVDTGSATCGDTILNTATITDPLLAGEVMLDASTELAGDLLEVWDFEADDGGFVADPVGEWEWGTPTYPAGLTAYSGVNVWGTDLDADADDDIDNHILTKTVTIPMDPRGVSLEWWDWNGAEAADERLVYINDTLVWSDGGDEDQRYWAPHSVDLTPWMGQQVNIIFNLEVCCSGAGPDGWYIDDVAFRAGCPSVAVEPDQTQEVCTPGMAEYQVMVTNYNDLPDTVDIGWLSDGTWPVAVEPMSMTLDPGAMGMVTVTVDVPWHAPEMASQTVTVTADSQNFDLMGEAVLLTTYPGPEFWTERTFAPGDGARYPAVVHWDGGIYLAGGENPSATSDVFRYDIATDSWSQVTGLITPVMAIDGAAIDGKIYIPGGDEDPGADYSAWLQIYDTGTDSWGTGAQLPMPLRKHEVVAHDGLLYVIGGESDGTITNTLLIYDPFADAWSYGPPMQDARRDAASGVIGGKIYVAGGDDDNADPGLASVEVFDPDTNAWTSLGDMPGAWQMAADGVIHDRYLILAGGWENDFTASNGARIYDADTDTWMNLPLLTSQRYGAEGASDGGANFYHIAGREYDGSFFYSTRNETLIQCPAVAGGIMVDADPLAIPTCPGDTEMLDFQICNEGNAPLNFSISDAEVGGPLGNLPPKISAVSGPVDEAAAIGKPGAEPWDVPVSQSVIEGYGPPFQSGWAMITPTLDGILDPGEWDDAHKLDITNPDDPPTQTVTLFVKNDNDKLYLAVDNPNDTTFAPGNFDQMGWYFDDIAGTSPILYDGIWNNEACGNADGEGNFWFGNFVPPAVPNSLYREWIYEADACGWIPAVGATSVVSNAAGNVQFEAEIDLTGGSPLIADASAMELFGFYIYVQDADVGLNHGSWPPGNVFFDPSTYGNLRLAHDPSTDAPWLSQDPFAGAVAVDECLTITVHFDATELDPGEYLADILIESSDPAMPQNTLPVTLTVWAPAEGASFVWSPTMPQVGATVNFTGSIAAGDPPFTFTWDFDDGSGDAGMYVSHTYADPGDYVVTLMVQGAHCDPAVYTDIVTIEPLYYLYLPMITKNYDG